MQRSRRHALVVGFDYYGHFLARLLNEESEHWRLTYHDATRISTVRAIGAALTADAIISFGGPGPNVALVEIARRRGIPVIVIWAGTDVLTACNDPQLLEVIKRYGFTNIADGPWLVDELRSIGIEARYVPVTAIEPATSIEPLPSTFSVLTYLPEPRRAFYGEQNIYAIAREFPDVPFRVVGRGTRNPIAPPNVEFLGHVDDMPGWIDRSSVLLRLPAHDGKSMLVLETLARGRHVVWNYDFPGVHHAAQVNDAMRILRGLRDAAASGTLDPNRGGYEYAARNFRRPQLASNLASVLDAAVHIKAAVRTPPRRVAISGLDLFAAHVAVELESHSQTWTAELMRTRARLEVATSAITLATCEVWYSIGAPIGDRWLHLLARLLGKPRVIHWVGSDIAALSGNRGLRKLCRQRHVRNLAEADWTIAELRELGIEARLAPLPPRLRMSQVPAMPPVFTVLFYLPKTRGNFYGRLECERLIRAMSTLPVAFIAVGGGDFYAPPEANVRRLGWQSSLDEIYSQSSVLLRFTEHDGLSLMTLEALSYGRHVLWTQAFPFTTRVRTYHDIEREIRNLLEAHEAGQLAPQSAASRYVAQAFAPDRCIERIVEAWEDASTRAGLSPVAGAAQ